MHSSAAHTLLHSTSNTGVVPLPHPPPFSRRLASGYNRAPHCAPAVRLPASCSTHLHTCRSPTEQVWPASKQQKKCELPSITSYLRMPGSHEFLAPSQSGVAIAVAARVHGALTSVILQHAAYRETLLQQHGFTVLEVRHLKQAADCCMSSECAFSDCYTVEDSNH